MPKRFARSAWLNKQRGNKGEELAAEYDKFQKAYNVDIDRIKAAIPEREVSADLAVGKAIDFIKASAVITEVAKKDEKAPAAKKTAAKKTSAKKAADGEAAEKPAKKAAPKKAKAEKAEKAE